MNAMLAVVPAVDGSPDAVLGHLSVRKTTPGQDIWSRYDCQIQSKIFCNRGRWEQSIDDTMIPRHDLETVCDTLHARDDAEIVVRSRFAVNRRIWNVG